MTRTKTRKPEALPKTFEDHVQIHQVGDDIGLAIIQGLQGLKKKEQDQHRHTDTGMKQSK